MTWVTQNYEIYSNSSTQIYHWFANFCFHVRMDNTFTKQNDPIEEDMESDIEN